MKRRIRRALLWVAAKQEDVAHALGLRITARRFRGIAAMLIE